MRVTRLSGFFAPNWLALQPLDRLSGIFERVGRLALQGAFESPVDATYPLDQARDAIEVSQVRGRTGKILLRIGG